LTHPTPTRHDLTRAMQPVIPGGRVLRAWPLTGGISAQMMAVEVADRQGQRHRLVVRLRAVGTPAQDAAVVAREGRLVAILQHTDVAAPVLRHVDVSGRILPGPYLILEHIRGHIDLNPGDPIVYAQRLAEALARIHAVAIEGADLSFMPRAPHDCPEVGRQSVASEPQIGSGAIREAMAALGPPPRAQTPVLLHGDFWPGNVLWRGGRLAAVIDWEDALVGDPMIDLAITRLELAWILGLDAMDALTARYRALRTVNDDALVYWDLCAALRFMRLAGGQLDQWARFFWPYGRRDITAQTIRRDYGRFVERAIEGMGR
jgi:aminoglycoside phosphotransferase (APT) family kinase protein